MKHEVCQLTKREAHRFEHQDREPDCRHHAHVGVEEAFRLVRAQRARWVKTGPRIVREIVHWAAKMSGGMKVMQLVEGDQVRVPAKYPSIRPREAIGV